MTSTPAPLHRSENSQRRILAASLAGTTIEFFDFYIYATAAVLVFPRQFFPASDPASATLQSFATFALAFYARPLGSAVFGHFGDRVGRKATLVAALLTMGLSTVAIGLLPTYATIGVAAPLLLALCRFGQGFGLGGEWGGAVLLATENAPPGRRAWYGMFPQLGAPIGFFLSGGVFLLLSSVMSDAAFASFGWRIPFVSSGVLVFFGLYVRLRLTETADYKLMISRRARVAVPILDVVRTHAAELAQGTVAAIATFALFYFVTVFCLSWGTQHLGYTRGHFLIIQLGGVVFFAATIPVSAILAGRHGCRRVMILISGAIAVFGLFFAPLFSSGPAGVIAAVVIGFVLIGITYGPLGTLLAELFPTSVRYTGSSLAFNLAGVLGASMAPYAATWLATHWGLSWVGYYLAASALLSLGALLFVREEARV